jgi:hypothetical protein
MTSHPDAHRDRRSAFAMHHPAGGANYRVAGDRNSQTIGTERVQFYKIRLILGALSNESSGRHRPARFFIWKNAVFQHSRSIDGDLPAPSQHSLGNSVKNP